MGNLAGWLGAAASKVVEYQMCRAMIVLGALALSMSGCVRPTEPTSSETKGAAGPTGPNFAGTWTGTYTIGKCTQSQDIARADVCGKLGTSSPYRLVLTQSNQGLVTASLTLEGLQFPSGSRKIDSQGVVDVNVITNADPYTVQAGLSLVMSESGLSGEIPQFWTSQTLTGKATINGRITTATRTP
jgi:hypothetical protein